MALFALLALLIASLAGLLAGRWRALIPVVPAIPVFAVLAGPVVGALTALAAVGMGVGVRLRCASWWLRAGSGDCGGGWARTPRSEPEAAKRIN